MPVFIAATLKLPQIKKPPTCGATAKIENSFGKNTGDFDE